MEKLIKNTEILNIFSLYLHHKDVIIKTSYCKILFGFPGIVTENLRFYQNKHGDLKREMTSLRETGGAVVMHIIFVEIICH